MFDKQDTKQTEILVRFKNCLIITRYLLFSVRSAGLPVLVDSRFNNDVL